MIIGKGNVNVGDITKYQLDGRAFICVKNKRCKKDFYLRYFISLLEMNYMYEINRQ